MTRGGSTAGIVRGTALAFCAATLAVAFLVSVPGAAGELERALTDRPDEQSGSQIHLVYVLPSDGDDRQLDMNGTIVNSVAVAQEWLASQTEGRTFRIDTFGGEPDITFFQMPQTEAEIAATNQFVRDLIEDELIAAGFDGPNKLYAVYYDGQSNYSCGGGAWPPTLTGTVAALYLDGFPQTSNPCRNQAFRVPGQQPWYWEFSFLHEIVHTLGFVATCAPNHHQSGHVTAPTNDLMYAGTAPWNLTGVLLDQGNDDYFGHSSSGCADLADSPFLTNPPQDTELVLTGYPQGTIGDDQAAFSFHLAGADSYQCRTFVVGTPEGSKPAFATCSGVSNGYHFATGLADGAYTFEVRAVEAGQPGGVTSHDFSVTSDPVVQWLYEPGGTYDSRYVTATFTAAGATQFQCSLDGAGFALCGSGGQGYWTSAELADGSHTLEVRANDGGGFGPVATAVFTVQAAPRVIWVTTPQGTYTTRYVAATFQAERPTGFQCSLDGVTFSSCGSGLQGYWTSGELANGSYTLHVRAQDAKGPGSVSLAPFTIAKPLAIEWIARPTGTINGSSVAATFQSDGATGFECSLDSATFASCGSGLQGYWTAAPAAGSHTLSVRARDAQNTGSEASTTFTTGSASGTPLEVTVTAGPDEGSTISSAWAAFSWSAPGAIAYRFGLDDDDLTNNGATSATRSSFQSLADGVHTLRVQALSSGNVWGPLLTHTFTVDTRPQTTVQIVAGPDEGSTISSAWAAFSWSARGAIAYRFGLDDDDLTNNGATSATRSSFQSLADGVHTLRVQALSSGNVWGPLLTHTFTVDTRPQTTVQIVAGPDEGSTISSAWAAFSWSARGAIAYRFGLDDDDLTNNGATSATRSSFQSLADGVHTLRVQALSSGNVWGPLLTHTFTVQSGPWVSTWSKPRVTLPVGTAAFSWSARGAIAYRFGLDDDDLTNNGATSATRSSFQSLADGVHTLRVQALSSGNVWGPVAATTFLVETRDPQTTIDSGPPAYSSSATATFAFHADEPATFECRIDGGAWTVCSSPWVRPSLTEGSHEVEIRAIDLAGKTDPTPAKHLWVLDTIAPTVIDLTGPTGVVSDTDATFTYGADETPVTFECRLDGGGWSSCGASKAYIDLPDGSHLFEVRATDRAGNVGLVKSQAWAIVTDPPETAITSAPTGSVNVDTASIEFDSPDSPVSFECSLDGASFAACSSPQPLADLDDGAHTFAVRAVKGGVMADPTPATALWTVDTQAPVVTITSGPSGTVGLGNTTFSFTANESATYECKLDAGDWAACTSQHGVGVLPGGTHGFQVRATDTAGNVGAPVERTWTVDDVVPVVAITSGPAALTTATDAAFAFTVDDLAATIECRLDGGAWQACASPAAYTGVGDGAHTFRVRATDPAGNVSAVQLWSWTIDTVAPVVTITDGPTGIVSATSAAVLFTVDEPGASAECRLDVGSWQPCTSPMAYNGLSNGSHTVEIRATDLAGNMGEIVSRSWDVDTVAPIVTITAGPSGTVADVDAEFAFTIDDASASAECRLDAGGWQSCSSPVAYPGLGSGQHTFQVRATDPAENIGPVAERTWTIDPVEPETTIESGPPSLTNLATASIEFASDTLSATFECDLDGGGWQACTSPLELAGLADGHHELKVRAVAGGLVDPTPATRSWTVDTAAPVLTVTSKPSGTTSAAGGRFEFTVDDATATTECRVDGGSWSPCTSPFAPALSDGQHTVDIRAVDPAGNVSPVDSTTWTVDATLPEVQITSGPTGTTTERDGQFTFTVSDPTATVECRFDSVAWVPCTSPAPFTGLADGPHSFDVRATDAAGNVSAEGRIWFIDASPPVVTIVSGPAGWTISPDAVIAFTVDDPAAILSCALDGAPYVPCASPVSLTGLSDGEHTLTITATDPLGNVSDPVGRTWTVDRTPPVVTILSGPDGVVSVDDVTFVFVADDPSTFRCRIDGGAWVACTSPVDYTDLAVSDHVFEVEATNLAGLTGAIAGRDFTIEILGEPLLTVDVLAVLPGGTPAPVVQTGLGDDFAFRVTVANNGPVAAEDTVLTVPLSGDVTLVGSLPAGCTSPDDDGPVTCDLGIVGAGLSSSVEIGVEATFACTVWGDSGDSTDAAPLLGTTGDDVICGGGGGDVIRGRGGNDVVWGYGNRVGNPLAGPDSVSTGASVTYGPGSLGGDAATAAVVTIAGPDGNDTITTGSGADTIRGEEGDDKVTSGGGADTVDAGDGNDAVDSGSGEDTVSGGVGNDQITSGDADDRVDGGSGNDVIGGGLGLDTIDGGDGADTVNGNDGNDVLRGGEGTDSLAGAAGDDALFGDAGSDTLTGAAGNDAISGGDGDDTADGGPGNDSVAGDGGNDALRGGDNGDEIRGGAGNDSTDGGGGDDVIFGEAGSDNLLFGGSGNDEISGGDGNDTADGGAGNDAVAGDGGNDTLRGGADVDEVRGGDGNDAADGGGGDDVIFGEAGNDNLLAGGSGNDAISGGEGDDTADGGPGNDSVAGEGGNDTLRGGDNGDEIRGGEGNDSADGGGGDDVIFGEAGSDNLLFGGSGNDGISGGDGNDTADGGGGTDTVVGEGGEDVLRGGAGNATDTLRGDEGIDTIHGDGGDDVVRGGADDDKLFGDAGSDAMNGDDGDDEIHGNDGKDRVDGGEGTDGIYGEAGDDDLYGGLGSDLIDGGDGVDFVIGENGDDRLFGGSGQDVVIGDDTVGDFDGDGNDELHGGTATNSDTGSNWLYGNGGDDEMLGGSRADFMFGSNGNDVMYGYDGNDIMLGDEGDDWLYGGNGADELHGLTATGPQPLDCGPGNDWTSNGPPSETHVACESLRDYDPARVPAWPRVAGAKP